MVLLTSTFVALAVVGAVGAQSGAGTSLDPIQPVLLPNAALAKNPLAHLGANGPWTAGKHSSLLLCDQNANPTRLTENSP